MRTNFKHSNESIQKIKEARCRQVITQEHKDAISKTLTGRKRTKEECLAISKGLTGKRLSEDHKKKISNTKKGIPQTKEQIEARRKGLIGKITREETRQKISNTLINREFTNDSKKKMRLGAIKRLEESIFNGGQMFPNYNPLSISLLEQKAKELGIIDLQHAENGGEFYIEKLGYWVDGYSKEKNIVIEYYEKYHTRTKKRDKQRQKEIETHLGCKFIIISE